MSMRLLANPEPTLPQVATILQLIGPRFDAEFYAAQYCDLAGDPNALLVHFCERGWKEGRNPNAGFDTHSYLVSHPDLESLAWNPLHHYLAADPHESKLVVAASPPRNAAQRFFGYDPGNWVTLLRPEVDLTFYRAQFEAAPDDDVDLVAHFAYCGWLEGKNPNPRFDVIGAMARRPDLRGAHINPLIAEIVWRQSSSMPGGLANPSAGALGVLCTRFSPPLLQPTCDTLDCAETTPQVIEASNAFYDDEVECLVAREFDRSYYLAMYQSEQDFFAPDPVTRFCQAGWKEYHNPASWFDTRHYLSSNPDIAAAGINPFWHYLVAGRDERRKASRPGGLRRRVIEAAIDPDTRTRDWTTCGIPEVLTSQQLGSRIAEALGSARGLAVSLSHDVYFRETGGVQIFIAEEQRRYAAQGVVYRHLSPVRPLLRLAARDYATALVNIVINGDVAGVASYDDVKDALCNNRPREGEYRQLIVHCLFGHHIPGLLSVHTALQNKTNVFWVHDYSSICVGYNLLRNDVEFCAAPPPDSMACRICVYGEHRKPHLAQIDELFSAVAFDVAAPSQAALDRWQQHANLPYRSVHVHPHCNLQLTDERPTRRHVSEPVRAAFVGYPSVHKGWPAMTQIASLTAQSGTYEFVRIGSTPAYADAPGIDFCFAQTTAAQPDAMVQTIRELKIDLVLALAPWPETLSYVAYEALAGGADIFCLKSSGNIADMVLKYGRGVVIADEANLLEFFVSGQAAEYVRLCRRQGTPYARLERQGTTATLNLAGH